MVAFSTSASPPGGACELGNERIERAVLVMGRTEIAQAGMELTSDALGKRHREPRLANARLTQTKTRDIR
jgi:hypothetical protein